MQKIAVPQKVFGPKNFGFRNIMGPEKFEAKLPENLGVPIFVVPKEFRDPKKFGPKFWVQKNFGSRKILGLEKFWILKNSGSQKNFWS